MKKILLVVVGVLLALALGLAAAFYFRPIAAFERLGRGALSNAGLQRTLVDGPGGPIEVWAGGSGPAIVFVHGANDYAGTWARVAPALAGSHRIVVFDLPGHGHSAPLTGPLSMADIIRGTQAVIARETGPVTLVGNSLGGWISLNVAHRNPSAVSHVILVNGAATEAKFGEGIDLLPKDREAARRAMAGITGPASPKTPDFVLDDLVRRAPGSALARLQSRPIEREWFIDAQFPSMDVPVSILWGDADRLLPLAYARGFATLFRRARLETLPGCGHMPQRECSAELIAALSKALAAPPDGPIPQPASTPTPAPDTETP